MHRVLKGLLGRFVKSKKIVCITKCTIMFFTKYFTWKRKMCIHFSCLQKNLGMCVKWGKIYTWGQGRPERISLLLSKRVTMIVKFHEKVSLTFKWVKEGRNNWVPIWKKKIIGTPILKLAMVKRLKEPQGT